MPLKSLGGWRIIAEAPTLKAASSEGGSSEGGSSEGGSSEAASSEGPTPIVYLHGWGRTRHDFAGLARARPGLALDLPGFGSSPSPPQAMGSREYAVGVLEAVTQWTEGRSFVVVGHSFGGRIALQIANLAPTSVQGLIVAGTPLFRSPQIRSPLFRSPQIRTPRDTGGRFSARKKTPEGQARSESNFQGTGGRFSARRKSPSLRYRAIRTLAKLRLISPARLEAARQRYGSADYRQASGVMRDILVRVVNESYERELAQLACPTAFVWGSQDTEAPVENAVRAHELVAGSILEVQDCGHNVHLHSPTLFISPIDKFSTPPRLPTVE